MGSTDRPASAPERTARRRIAAGYIIAAAIVAAIVFSLVGRHLYYRSKINAELDAIRRAGFPVTLQELSDYYPVPQGDNAADVYTQAFAKFAGVTVLEEKLPVVGSGKLPLRTEPLPREMQTAISAYLTSNAQALNLLHKAAAIEGCHFDLDWTQGHWMLMPHLAPLRQAERLLGLQALMKAEEGKPDEAAEAIAASFAAAHSLRNEPRLLSQLVLIVVDDLSLGTLERVLSRTVLTDKQLTDLSTRIASEDTPEPLLRGMVGERCTEDDSFRRGAWEPSYTDGLFLSPFRRKSLGILYRLGGREAQDRLMYLKLMSELVSIGSGTTKDVREQPALLEKRIQQLPMHYILTRLIIGGLSRAYEKQLMMFARLRAARAGIAVERFRVANGHLPDSLGELTPKWLDTVPTDPFDDKPIRYKKLAKGFVTYSIGPDLKDDGGKERDPTNSNAPYDITFIIER